MKWKNQNKIKKVVNMINLNFQLCQPYNFKINCILIKNNNNILTNL